MQIRVPRSYTVTGLAVLTLLASISAGPPSQSAQSAAAAGKAPQSSTSPSAAPAPSDPAWHYEGTAGPASWGTLSPKFATCGNGRSQSPIDIVNPTTADAKVPLKMQFPPAALKIAHHEHVADGINNGHTIQINYSGADTLTIGNDSYPLIQYHFHSPSEHTVDGKHSPMEMHLVHKAAGGQLAVVGVFIGEGAHNKAFDPVWAELPGKKGVETHYPAITVDVDALLPSVRTSYRYDGSLTTPPCSESVRWIIMTTPIHLSAEQIRTFTRLIRDNNRPTQPLNGRKVFTDAVSVGRN